METKYLDVKTAREISLEKVLSGMGYVPRKRTDTELWYISPFRNEKTASFKINTQINKWFDFGEQIGGNTLDFVIHKFGLSVKEALQYLSKYSSFSFQQPNLVNQEKGLLILGVRDIIHIGLIDYLTKRGIPASVYRSYCKQIYYEHERRYFAIGFANNSGSYELRSKYFKGCIGKKDITTFTTEGSLELLVFEGFFDFLSYKTLYNRCSNIIQDYIILNSLSNLQQLESLLVQYQIIRLYLDNDEAGDKAVEKVLSMANRKRNIVDARSEYSDFKDLNEYLLRRS